MDKKQDIIELFIIEQNKYNKINDHPNFNENDIRKLLNSINIDKSLKEQAIKSLTESLKKSKEFNSSLWSQEPCYYHICEYYLKEIKKVMSIKISNILDNILFGTLDKKPYNAGAISKDNQHLICVNNSFFNFLYIMAHAISICFPSENQRTFCVDYDKIEKNIKGGDFDKYFNQAILCSYYKNHLEYPELFFQYHNTFLAEILWKRAELFIISHEVSHILINNLNMYNNIKNQDIQVQEYEADKLAFMITYSRFVKSAFIGVSFYFLCMKLLEYIENEVDNYFYIEYIHPSLNDRFLKIRNQFYSIATEENFNFNLLLSNIINKIFKILWERNKPYILSNLK